MQEAPQQAVAGLSALAEKLAVPAAHVWAVLVRQAPIEAIEALVFAVLVAVASWYWAKFLRWCLKDDQAEDYDMVAFIAFIGSLIMLVTVVLTIFWVLDTVGYLVNPEYFAITKVLDAIKK